MVKTVNIPRLPLFPLTAGVNEKGHLSIGGCDVLDMAGEFGTPLYVFDEAGLRARCREFKNEFTRQYPNTTVCYSAKAFTALAMLRLAREEGLDLDVVMAGELFIAREAGFPMARVHFPGNNKSADELEMAVASRLGHIVVDNRHELDMLIRLAGRRKVNILLRLNPGIDPHTHKYNTTGIADSKFGFPRDTWDKGVAAALSASNLNVDGLHFHIGSGIFEMEPYAGALDVVLEYAAELKKHHGFTMKTLSIGGGYGVQYLLETGAPPSPADWAKFIAGKLTGKCRQLNLDLPRLMIEPGRAIVARAGVGVYTIGAIKEIPGIRTYVAVDGGMGDNIRYPMYGFKQVALIADRPAAKDTRLVTVAGKYCESGDILIPDINLPDPQPGDILAMAGSGAYAVPMQMNYNGALRPAIVFVKDGQARVVRRRETFADLIRNDI